MRHLNGCKNKRIKGDANFSRLSISCSKKLRHFLSSGSKEKASAAWVDLIQLMADEDVDDGYDVNCFPSTSNCHSLSSILEPDRPYTVGRSKRHAQFIFKDPRISKRHCQFLFDASLKKLYLLNGALLFSASACGRYSTCIVNQFRDRLLVKDKERGNPNPNPNSDCNCTYKFKASLNGIFVNGVKLGEGLAVELCAGDEVMLFCVNRSGVCGSRSRIGFIVRRIVFQEEVVIPGCGEFQFGRPRLVRPLLSGKVNKRVFALRVSDSESPSSECDEVIVRANSLSAHCKRILHSSDPISCILGSLASHCHIGGSFPGFEPSQNIQLPGKCGLETNVPVPNPQNLPCESAVILKGIDVLRDPVVQSSDIVVSCEKAVPLQPKAGHLYREWCAGASSSRIVDNNTAKASVLANMGGRNHSQSEAVSQNECWKEFIPPPVKNFYLNRLESMHPNSFGQQHVSLPELLHPLDSISRMFIATFTSDIRWFLSYCDIPSCMPVTLACHSKERCWSGDPDKRSCVPYPDFPNLVVVYPPFPEVIAFGKDRKRQGVACHHPKFLVLQREDTIRVIITSANLVAKQLAGFMATLVTDVPSQAYWIDELTKYDFTGANAYLVASVPGIHSYRSLSATLPVCMSKCSEKFFGSVEASVVGLSHLFRAAADSNGVQLKKLAAYLGKSSEKGCRMSEIVLRRDYNVPADANAVSVLVPNPMKFSKADFVGMSILGKLLQLLWGETTIECN